MARARRLNLWPICLSLSAASTATGLRRKFLADRVADGSLEAHVVDRRTIILVESLVSFIKTHPLKERS